MTETTFAAALSNVQAYLRAAAAAGLAGDPGAISAELVRAALTLGVQLGQLQAQYGAAHTNTRQFQAITRSLHDLQATAISAFAKAEQQREESAEPAAPSLDVTADYVTPYDGPAYGS